VNFTSFKILLHIYQLQMILTIAADDAVDGYIIIRMLVL